MRLTLKQIEKENGELKEIYLKIKERADKIENNIVWTPDNKKTYDLLAKMQDREWLRMFPILHNGKCKQLLILQL